MKRIAVLSTPRSGTQYVTAALRHFDVMVGHEKMDDDGIVCGFWAWAEITEGKLPCAQDITKHYDPSTEFEHTFHLYRDPLKSVRSMPNVLKRTDIYGRWLSKLGINGPGTDLFHTCLHYWIITHERLLRRDLPRINIDNIKKDWVKIADCLGLEKNLPSGIRTGRFESRVLRPVVTWRELDSLDIYLSRRAQTVWEKLSG
jgi:hypothetical protein